MLTVQRINTMFTIIKNKFTESEVSYFNVKFMCRWWMCSL